MAAEADISSESKNPEKNFARLGDYAKS